MSEELVMIFQLNIISEDFCQWSVYLKSFNTVLCD